MVVIQSLHIGTDPFSGFLLREGFPGKVVILQELLDKNRSGLISRVRLGNRCLKRPTGQKEKKRETHQP